MQAKITEQGRGGMELNYRIEISLDDRVHYFNTPYKNVAELIVTSINTPQPRKDHGHGWYGDGCKVEPRKAVAPVEDFDEWWESDAVPSDDRLFENLNKYDIARMAWDARGEIAQQVVMVMTPDQKKALEGAGWAVGGPADFLRPRKGHKHPTDGCYCEACRIMRRVASFNEP